MSVIELDNIKKYYGERKIFEINNLKIEKNEKIGIVGKNGSGKTTLFQIIMKEIIPEEGEIIVKGKVTYIKQFDEIEDKYKNLSGGEKTKHIISRKLKENTSIVLIDEPTNHLSIEATKEIERKLKKYSGTMLLISHDRELLDNVCTSILEIEDGIVNKYQGNYAMYQKQKKDKMRTMELEYEKYIIKKEQLQKSINSSKNTAKKMKKTPTRMGNSEARLHKRASEEIRQKIEGHSKALETRYEKLEKKEKPKEIQKIFIQHFEKEKIPVKYLIMAENLNIRIGEKEILSDTNFQLLANEKTALIGENGSGKTTLIQEILKRKSEIYIHKQAEIGYFSQELTILNQEKTVLENVLERSIQNEIIVKNVLANLSFYPKDLEKKVKVLSGGEKVKIALAKLLLADYNILVLDEPTNFLDIQALEALERLIKEYKGTILFVSHDRHFINQVANHLMIIENKKIKMWDGKYDEYLAYEKSKEVCLKNDSNKLLLEMKIASLISQLSIEKDEKKRIDLEKEYQEILKEL